MTDFLTFGTVDILGKLFFFLFFCLEGLCHAL